MSVVTNPTLLLLSDDFEFAELVSLEFGYEGFRVSTTPLVAQARERLRREPPDVVVLPFGWAVGRDHEIDELLEKHKPLVIPAEALMRLQRPGQILPLVRRGLQRRTELDLVLGKMHHFLQGKRLREGAKRFCLDLPVRLRWTGRDTYASDIQAKTFNLSAHGVFVALTMHPGQTLAKGEVCTLLLDASESRLPSVGARAEVTWVRPQGSSLQPQGFGAHLLR